VLQEKTQNILADLASLRVREINLHTVGCIAFFGNIKHQIANK
jgi:hypothetical protein